MEIAKFRGLRNRTSPERMKPGDLLTATDIDIDDTGAALSRRGYVIKNVASCHSLFATNTVTLVVSGGFLNIVEDDYSFTPLQPLVSNAPVSYDSIADVIYYSNGTDKGRVIRRAWSCWGVDAPIGQPVASAGVGNLAPGRYLYAVTFVRNDGHESGTPLSGTVELTAQGGIDFGAIAASPNPEVVGKYLYISLADGETLYRVDYIPNTQTTYSYRGAGLDLGPPLVTQHAGPPPADAGIVRLFNGIAYAVVNDVVYYSDPYNYDLFRLDTSFLRFPGPVANFESVNNGLYVSTEDVAGEDAESNGTTYFLGGKRPDKFESSVVFDYGSIVRTSVKTDAAYFKGAPNADSEAPEQSNPAVVWYTRHGIVVGFDGGAVMNLTEGTYSLPDAQLGAGFIKLDRGFAQYVASLQGVGPANNAYTETIT